MMDVCESDVRCERCVPVSYAPSYIRLQFKTDVDNSMVGNLSFSLIYNISAAFGNIFSNFSISLPKLPYVKLVY